mmetsp:Transcript_38014/g.49927  ORF Transcript_38014/g.49927 Transcript_38014/m.49927 type:complete len:94 (+) Transcript_38014:355-636(+)
MGLLICQNLVRENGGTMQVFSKGENQGSAFGFTMKMKVVQMSTASDSAPKPSSDASTPKNKMKPEAEPATEIERSFDSGKDLLSKAAIDNRLL